MSELMQAADFSGKKLYALGAIAIILGVLAMLAPGVTGISVALLLGLLVTSAGILRMIWAFQASSFGKGLLTFALGTLTLVAGLVLFANPLLGAGVMAIMLAVYFILDGTFEVAAGITSPHGIWLILGGIVSIALGLIVWAQYPLFAVWTMGMLVGIKLFFIGLSMINSGSIVRSFAGTEIHKAA